MSDSIELPAGSGDVVRRKRTSWAPIVIVGAILAIGFLVVGSSTSGGAGMYSYSLQQLSQAGADVQGRDIKVTGKVAAGSVRGEPASAQFRFDLEDAGGHRLTVAYNRLLPDPFQEGREAIVQGRMEGNVLKASALTVKCPSRYGDTDKMSAAERQRYEKGAYKQHKAVQ